MKDDHSLSQEDLTQWLAVRISDYVRLPVASIGADVPLSQYGLDSVYALTLTGEISDYLGVELPSTVMWDYPTLQQLTTALLAQMALTSHP